MIKKNSKLIFFAISVFVVSCSDSPTLSKDENITQSSKLIAQLTAYNNQLPTEISRIGGIGWLSVAGADVYGSYRGAKLQILV